ncbi:zeta toxin family protein [Chitinophaga niabensis]|uniref:Predicted ABC-type ATPase n=1 Tax=Chitinophaga niabensis TaxID=536979 RepID=A0A1N6GLS6_9BACT|nr:zeta toxin family protein [Chitinophaga niabensis]SIO08486.1 Predicted ABC-type ATPase [Chitinophaga niabensis]
MPKMYIIAGCNGAGKTTSSFAILPEILHCKEFVNADNIASGISPFNPESVAIEAGRLMLTRIDQLMQAGEDFAFETTLSTRSYVSLIQKAQAFGYKVQLCYLWLESPQLALRRVKSRVAKGGHHIPEDVIIRRYHRSVENLVSLYIPVVDKWSVHDNTSKKPALVAEGNGIVPSNISIPETWFLINKQTDVMEHYNQPVSEFSIKVTEGISAYMRKLIETNAALNQTMIIGDGKGNVLEVPAKELLAEYEREDAEKLRLQ